MGTTTAVASLALVAANFGAFPCMRDAELISTNEEKSDFFPKSTYKAKPPDPRT